MGLTPMPVVGSTSSRVERYVKDAVLTGTAVYFEHISGCQGTDFELREPVSDGIGQHAVDDLT